MYSLLDSADGAFSIDEHSGVLRLATPLDRELQPLYTLQAQAMDRGWPRPLSTICSVTVSVLDLNDDPPVFQRHDYIATIPEDIAAGTQVLRVHAASRDAEAQISYAIVDGNERGVFSVDTHTGKLRDSSHCDISLTLSPPRRQNETILAINDSRIFLSLTLHPCHCRCHFRDCTAGL